MVLTIISFILFKISGIYRFMKTNILSFVLFFTSLNAQAGVLFDLVLETAQSLEPKVFVFDLDETLIDSIPRRYLALHEAIQRVCPVLQAPDDWSDLSPDCKNYRSISLYDFYKLSNRYDTQQALKSLGIQDMELLSSIDKSMFSIYLSGNYIEFDQAYLGAVAFVQSLQKAGAEIYFVSSRSLEKQNTATRESLKKLGFIKNKGDSHVILKPDSQSSIDFKTESFEKIKQIAEQKKAQVLGVFENEPENMNAMMRVFPKAKAVFVKGAMVKNTPLEGKPALINDYLEYN